MIPYEVQDQELAFVQRGAEPARFPISASSSTLTHKFLFKYLNQLRVHGLIATTVDALDQIPKFERDELEQLLARLNARVTKLKLDGTDMVSLIEATQRVRCPLVDIVKLILPGKLTHVCRDAEIRSLAAFRISLLELRSALPQFEMPGVTKGDAFRRLRVNYPTINFLIAEGCWLGGGCAIRARASFWMQCAARGWLNSRRNSRLWVNFQSAMVGHRVRLVHTWKRKASAPSKRLPG